MAGLTKAPVLCKDRLREYAQLARQLLLRDVSKFVRKVVDDGRRGCPAFDRARPTATWPTATWSTATRSSVTRANGAWSAVQSTAIAAGWRAERDGIPIYQFDVGSGSSSAGWAYSAFVGCTRVRGGRIQRAPPSGEPSLALPSNAVSTPESASAESDEVELHPLKDAPANAIEATTPMSWGRPAKLARFLVETRRGQRQWQRMHVYLDSLGSFDSSFLRTTRMERQPTGLER